MVAQRYHGVKHLTPLAISEQLNLTLCLSPLDTHIMLVTEGEGRSAKAQYQAVHVHMERLTALPEGKRQKVVTKRSYEYYSLFYCYTKINYHPYFKSIQYTVYGDKQRLWTAT